MVKIAHLALACLAATCAAQDTGRRKLDDDDTDVIHAKKAWHEAYGTDGPDAETCDLFRESTCLRWHKTKGVFPDQPKWSLERCADQGNVLDGGFHISTDTCGDCTFSTCFNCTP